MFDQIFDAIEEWMRELLSGIIHSNLDRMFTDVNEKTGEIAVQVGMTPQGWNSSIFSMIETLFRYRDPAYCGDHYHVCTLL